MKRLFTPFLLFAALSTSAQVVHTVVIRPKPLDSVHASISMELDAVNCGDENLIANAWTAGGNDLTQRSLFRFPLPTLPSNATFVNATLTLYGNPTTTHHQKNSYYQGSPNATNGCYLQRITSAWKSSAVKWSTQPSVTASHQISLAPSDSVEQIYSINATQMVKDMLDTPSKAYGFMLMLQNETKYRTMIFSSSMHADSNYRPSLTITYTTPSGVGVASVSNVGNDVQIYPNPARGTLHLSLNNATQSKVAVQLTDATGRRVIYLTEELSPKGNMIVNVESLPRGLYFVGVQEGDKAIVGRTISLQ